MPSVDNITEVNEIEKFLLNLNLQRPRGFFSFLSRATTINFFNYIRGNKVSKSNNDLIYSILETYSKANSPKQDGQSLAGNVLINLLTYLSHYQTNGNTPNVKILTSIFEKFFREVIKEHGAVGAESDKEISRIYMHAQKSFIPGKNDVKTAFENVFKKRRFVSRAFEIPQFSSELDETTQDESASEDESDWQSVTTNHYDKKIQTKKDIDIEIRSWLALRKKDGLDLSLKNLFADIYVKTIDENIYDDHHTHAFAAKLNIIRKYFCAHTKTGISKEEMTVDFLNAVEVSYKGKKNLDNLFHFLLRFSDDFSYPGYQAIMKSKQHSKAIDAFRNELGNFIEGEKETKKAGRKESSTSRVSFNEEVSFADLTQESETDDLLAEDIEETSKLQLSSVRKLTETKTQNKKKGLVMV